MVLPHFTSLVVVGDKLRLGPFPVNRQPQDVVVECTQSTTCGVSGAFPMSYRNVPDGSGRLNSATPPPVSHQFPAGYPQAFAQASFPRFLSKSAVSPVVLHMIFMHIFRISRMLVFISFFVRFPARFRRRKGRKAGRIQNLRKRGLGGLTTTTRGGPGMACTQNVARGTIFRVPARSVLRREGLTTETQRTQRRTGAFLWSGGRSRPPGSRGNRGSAALRHATVAAPRLVLRAAC
jgi:hypothetical protein